MNSRIIEIRKHLNMTQSQFGAEIGASRGMIAKYETGLVAPDKTMIMLICQKFNVNESWLETGVGAPYKEGLIPELMRALHSMPAVQAALERALPSLTVEDFQRINDLVDKLFGGASREK